MLFLDDRYLMTRQVVTNCFGQKIWTVQYDNQQQLTNIRKFENIVKTLLEMCI